MIKRQLKVHIDVSQLRVSVLLLLIVVSRNKHTHIQTSMTGAGDKVLWFYLRIRSGAFDLLMD